ncbi:hypothetical protein AB1Y20_001150 [Prymnesium parvum]|uniref:Uncharacterized protein n=1 Tax=Prymnesium parvum TaxID=97485 RepID=A0AB34K7D3_PRYPA
MAEKRPWWHEIVAGLSTERTPAPWAVDTVGSHQLTRPSLSEGLDVVPRPPRSPGAVLRRRLSEWDPGSPAMEWVRRATFDGRALAIRRAQDAHRRRPSSGLGITPILVEHPCAPRVRSGGPSHLSLAPPFDRAPAIVAEATSRTRPSLGACLPPPPSAGGPAADSRFLSVARAEPSAPRSPRATASAAACHTISSLSGPPTLPHHSSGLSPGVLLTSGARALVEAPQSNDCDVTNCVDVASRMPSILSLPADSGVHAPSSRRDGLSTAPASRCILPTGSEGPSPPLRGKGAKHARICAGPWASALANMPPMPPTGAKRAQAGLADVPLSSSDIASVRRERAACALASILPWAAAGFVLGDSPEAVASRPIEDTTARLVRALAAYGVSSTEAAYSALGRLMSSLGDPPSPRRPLHRRIPRRRLSGGGATLRHHPHGASVAARSLRPSYPGSRPRLPPISMPPTRHPAKSLSRLAPS